MEVVVLNLTLAPQRSDVFLMAARASPADAPPTREELLDQFRKGELHSLAFGATVFKLGSNANLVEVLAKDFDQLANTAKNKPFLKDHGGAGFFSSPTLDDRGGTVLESQTQGRSLKTVINAVKPWAIEGVLDGTIDRFSIAFRHDALLCSVCKKNFIECRDHQPGKEYNGKNAFLIPVNPRIYEISAVVDPAIEEGTGVDEILAAWSERPPVTMSVSLVTELRRAVTSKEGDVIEKLKQALGLSSAISEEGLLARAGELQRLDTTVRQALSLSETARQDQVLAKIVELTAPGTYVLKAEHDKVAEELAKLKSEGAVTSALQAGKLAPAMKEWALNYAARDPEGFKAFVANAPVQVPLKHAASGPPESAFKEGKPEKQVGEHSEMVMNRLGLTPEEFQAQMQAED